MNVSYKRLSSFVALLCCVLLQQCTHDLPSPGPVPPATQTAVPNRFAAAIAKGEIQVKYEKVAPASKKQAGVPVKGGANTSKLAQPVCYDYYQVYYDNTGAEVGRDFLYSDCPDGDGGGSGSGGGSNGDGGGGSNSDGNSPDASGLSANSVVFIPPATPVQNIQQFLKCLTTSQGATLTVYAAQPRAGTDDTWAGNPLSPRVGHAFISITQNGITRVLGFYPTSSISFVQNAPGILGDDSQHGYSVSVSTAVSPNQLNNLLAYIYTNSSTTYDLPDYNCTDFAIGAARAAGLYLPDTQGQWGGISGGSNPGNLGQDMRNMSLPSGATRTLSGTSPSNSGGC